MSKRLWPVFLGPPLILAGAVLAIGHAQPSADAAKPVSLPRIASCSGPDGAQPGASRSGAARPGAWWKTTEQLDASGTLVGRKLFVGQGPTAIATEDLPIESSASGPVHGVVVVVADDGTTSRVRLVSAVAGCETLIHSTTDVVRSAILDPSDGSVLAHLIDRGTRGDLGTWRISPAGSGGSGARLVAPPLGDLGTVVGTVWATALRLDAHAAHLAVQSCADLGCLTRIFDLVHPGQPTILISGVDEGPLLGFAGADLVTWAACPGYPCAVLRWTPDVAKPRTLVNLAGAAGLTRDGRRLVALVSDGRVSHAIAVDPRTGRSTGLHGLAAGQRPLSTSTVATIGLEVADDEIVVGSGVTDPQAFRPDSATDEVLP
ncbi:MAG: hypothetical protein ACHQ3P_11035 [Candidatus Limnocylindrales bacterium]